MPSRHAGVMGRMAGLVQRTAARRGPRDASLEARVDRLEHALEALQDQLYRQARREDERFAALHHSLQPDEMARSLDAEARRRGI
jgi:hypothetical protein